MESLTALGKYGVHQPSHFWNSTLIDNGTEIKRLTKTQIPSEESHHLQNKYFQYYLLDGALTILIA